MKIVRKIFPVPNILSILLLGLLLLPHTVTGISRAPSTANPTPDTGIAVYFSGTYSASSGKTATLNTGEFQCLDLSHESTRQSNNLNYTLLSYTKDITGSGETSELTQQQIPMGSNRLRGSWSLLNLLLSLAGIGMMVITATQLMGKRRAKRYALPIVQASLLAVMLVFLFGTTNFTTVMEFTNTATIWFLLLAVSQLIISILFLRQGGKAK